MVWRNIFSAAAATTPSKVRLQTVNAVRLSANALCPLLPEPTLFGRRTTLAPAQVGTVRLLMTSPRLWSVVLVAAAAEMFSTHDGEGW